MARKKNYQVTPARKARTCVSTREVALNFLAGSESVSIDLGALLGSAARFAGSERNVDFSEWLERGIDAWVSAAACCIRAILLSGSREVSTVVGYSRGLKIFFAFLTDGERSPRVATPQELSPHDIDAFIDWLSALRKKRGMRPESIRTYFRSTKVALQEMFALGYIAGEPSRFFRRKSLPWQHVESQQTSLSNSEQERFANAIKGDLVDLYHGRLTLHPGDVQALRLLLVAHRQGTGPTPILELGRDSMTPGVIPGTICMRTVKFRNRKITSTMGRAEREGSFSDAQLAAANSGEIVFVLAEGAVLQQAIASTEALVKEATARHKNRIWLYRRQDGSTARPGEVTCLTLVTLAKAIRALVKRHNLLDDSGKELRVNLSRLRKSYFDRAFRTTGDLGKTANLMGNTPRVAGLNYPSMNEARKEEAAEFMNSDFSEMMRRGNEAEKKTSLPPRVIEVKPVRASGEGSAVAPLEDTPVSGCKDTLNGEHAPQDGHNHCDSYVMCLFCSSFAIVGTADELWRLFSFQAFAKAELECLEVMLGPERTDDDALEDLRDRYRIAIPYIDQFTKKQFSARVVKEARTKTAETLHPFWIHQLTVSRRARLRTTGSE